MELIDNVNKTLKDDLTVSIQKDSKISIAAACFSIYAFQELKRELKNVDELRFIFTSPTFIKEKAKKEKREFYIPRQTRERSLYGSEFEVKLRNEMTQRAIAKECAEWIRKKATFKSNVTSENMMGFMNVDSNSYMPLNGFTTIDLGCERGNNAYYPIQKTDTPMSQFYLDLFEQIWNDEARLQEVTDEVVDSITTVYSENSPDYIYFVTLYNIFNEFLEDVSEDVLPNEATGFKDSKIWNLLYNFQKDAVLAIINKLEKYNGSNLSDDGMGINMETYKIPLPPQVDRRKIQAKKDIISGKPIYRYHDTKFSLSKKQIIDLLMGTKLYGKPEVALRELLQNSIDACLLRQKLSELWGIEYTPKVKVSLYTKNNVDYLQVSDNGVGMNQHIIDNYYTNIGCSYYSSREFSDLMVSFKSSFTPISRFGIGILSCFMVCDSMEVTTRRIRERFECDEALHVSIEGYESLFVISDSDKKDPGTDTILTLRPVHPWDRMDEDEFVQCIKGIVPNPAVQIEIETDKRSESYSSDYFDDLDLSPLLDYSWNNTKNIRKIDIDLTCEEYGFKGRGCIGILIKNDMPVEEIEILSKDVEIDGEIYTLSSSVKYKNNCITETSTSISVDEDGEIDTNTSWSERFKSKSSLSIHGIEVPYNLFPNYSNKMSKAVLNILFPFSFRLDIGVNSDLNLNSARDQIIYDEKWLTFEENLYQVICKRLKEQLSLSDWERLNEIIQKNGKNIFSRVANNIE